jgi:hypothetical protein
MTAEQVTEYMSPYQQAVVDIEKREAQKQYESQVVPQLAAKAATTGGFGGSRQAILEGMAADTQQRLLSDIQAKGSQQAYEDAVKRFAADRQAQGQAGAQLATMAPQQFKTQLGELGALQTVGETRQKQQQTALDEAFRQYQLEQNYPYDTMARYQSIVTGAPLGQTTFAKPAPPAPSIGQQLISGIGTLAGTYGAFTGQNPLNLITGKKHGGGLSDLPVVYRQNNGKVGNYKFQNYPAGIVDVHPDYGYVPRGFTDQIRQGLEKTYPRDITSEDLYWQNWDKLGFGDKMHLQHSGLLDEGNYDDKLAVLQKYMNNTIKGQRKYEGSPFAGNINAIVESTITGDKITEFNEKPFIPTLATPTPTKPYISTGYRPENYPVDGEFTGEPQGELIDSNKESVDNRGDIDAGYREPPVDPKDVIPLPDLGQNFTRAGLEIEELNRKIAEQQKQERREKYETQEEGIQAAEGELQKLIEGREKANRKLLEQSQDAQTRAQYGNLAQFFARLGTATPKQEGFAGVLGAALGAADQTLPEVMATNEKFRGERLAIQKDINNNKIEAAQAKLGMLEKRAARTLAQSRQDIEDARHEERIRTEELRFNKTYEQKEREINAALAKAGALDITDEKNIDALIKSRYFGGSFNTEGNLVFAEGESIGKFGNDIAGVLSELTGNIMQEQGLTFNQTQPFIGIIKNKIDSLPQDILQKNMENYPKFSDEDKENLINNMVEKSGLDRSIVISIFER